jgi:hypothetical protein
MEIGVARRQVVARQRGESMRLSELGAVTDNHWEKGFEPK